MQVKHFLEMHDLTLAEYEYLFERAKVLKAKQRAKTLYQPLVGRVMAMIFEKNSTRTRISFQAGMDQLGGSALYLNNRDTQLGRGEPTEDAAIVISSMVDIVMIRTFEQTIVERFASRSKVPVINGLTNELHPCQIMADIFTFIEHRGAIQGKTVAWVGDTNNVCRTWVQAATIFGFNVHICTPEQYRFTPTEAEAPYVRFFSSPQEAIEGSHIVTTDVWTSMGFEEETERRLKDFAGYMITPELMNFAQPDAVFMHCLPAHRGEEVSAEVIDGAQSIVWDEAENRLHTQKALVEYLLLGKVE